MANQVSQSSYFETELHDESKRAWYVEVNLKNMNRYWPHPNEKLQPYQASNTITQDIRIVALALLAICEFE